MDLAEKLELPLAETSLSLRTLNTLERIGVLTVGQLLKKSQAELLAQRNFSRRTLQEVLGALADLGLHRGGKPSACRTQKQDRQRECRRAEESARQQDLDRVRLGWQRRYFGVRQVTEGFPTANDLRNYRVELQSNTGLTQQELEAVLRVGAEVCRERYGDRPRWASVLASLRQNSDAVRIAKPPIECFSTRRRNPPSDD